MFQNVYWAFNAASEAISIQKKLDLVHVGKGSVNYKKLLQWSLTTWQFSNPNPERPVSNSCHFFTSKPHINKVSTRPLYQTPRTHKRIGPLFLQLLLFYLHILSSTLFIPPERGSYTSLDFLCTTFKLDGFRKELAEESEEKINGRIYNPENNVPVLNCVCSN